MMMLQTLTMKHLESPRKCKLEKEKKEQGRAWLNTLKEKRNIEINFIFVGPRQISLKCCLLIHARNALLMFLFLGIFASVFIFIHFVFVFLVFQYISFVFVYALVPTTRGRKMKMVECQSMKARMAASDVIRNIAVRVNTFGYLSKY